MLLRIFKGIGPDVIVLIFITALLVWIGPLIHPSMPSASGFYSHPMPLFGLLLKTAGTGPLISVITTFLLVLLTSFLLVNFNTSAFFISERTFLPALFYILLTGLMPGQQVMNPVLPASIMIILAIKKIMDSYRVQYTAFSFFDAGLLIGTGSLFYAGLLWFGLLLIIGILLLRTGNLREIILSAVGFVTPWFLAAGFYYVLGNDPGSLWTSIKENLSSDPAPLSLSRLELVSLAITGAIALASIAFLYSIINSKKIKSHKTFNLLMWTLVLTGSIFFIYRNISMEVIWIVAIPVSYFLSHYFVFSRKKLIPEILFSAIILLVALIQITG